MKKETRQKFISAALLAGAVIATVEFQKFMKRRAPVCEDGICAVPSEMIAAKVTGPHTVPLMPPPATEPEQALPMLIDFGAGQCATCKMMDVVLDELAQAYSGKLAIRFVDAKKDTEQAEQYKIRMIPTQVFLDAKGNELFRHEGFMPKEDILKKWTELGVDLEDR